MNVDGLRVPDFLIIGAMRSGTTSLSRYLAAHPDVYIPPAKELHFFDRRYEDGMGWYAAQFSEASSQHAIGEATPRYLGEPQVPARIAAMLPEVNLIGILRNPVDRAYSHYWLNRAKGREELSFEAALRAEPERLRTYAEPSLYAYFERGRYMTHLERYLRWFPREQLHIVLFDDLRADADALFKGLCRYLGIDPAYRPAIVGSQANRFRELRSARVRKLSRAFPERVQDAIGRLNTKNMQYVPLEPQTRQALGERYREDNDALARWLDRDLTAWQQ